MGARGYAPALPSSRLRSKGLTEVLQVFLTAVQQLTMQGIQHFVWAPKHDDDAGIGIAGINLIGRLLTHEVPDTDISNCYVF
jgi:hypothetical protein